MGAKVIKFGISLEGIVGGIVDKIYPPWAGGAGTISTEGCRIEIEGTKAAK